MAATNNHICPSLIRAAEVLLTPRVAFSSAATKTEPKELDSVSADEVGSSVHPKTAPTSKPSFLIQHRPFESLFGHLWRTSTSGLPFGRYLPRHLIKEMDDLTQSRMDRWMLTPNIDFTHEFFGERRPSLEMWMNAEYDEDAKLWTVPIQIPNIFKDRDLSVSIVRDKPSNSYMLRICGQKEMKDSSEKDATSDADENAKPDLRRADDLLEKKGTSKSDYKYQMQFQLPPLPSTEMTTEQAHDYYSPITAHFNAEDGTLRVKIPERIVSPNIGDNDKTDNKFEFAVPIESAV